jgi:hypothetical protein
MSTGASPKGGTRASTLRACARPLNVLLLIAACCAWSIVAARQEPPPEGGSEGSPWATPTPQETPAPPKTPPAAESKDGGAAPPSTESQIPPEAESSYVVRTYKVRPAKLWKGLLECFQAAGFPPEDVDEAKRTVKTSFVDFNQDDYQLEVAEPPPVVGGNYHILQLIKVRRGKVSLEGVVAPAKRGTELRVRARILVVGLDRVKRVQVLADRRSSGVIEADVIHKLEARLGLEHL